MKASRYNITVASPESSETVLFNSLYGSITVWDNDEISNVQKCLDNPNTLEFDPIKSTLIEQKYLISDDIDEIAIIENRKKSGIEDKNRLDK